MAAAKPAGQPFRQAVLAALLFGVPMGVYFGFVSGSAAHGAVSGLLGGAAFGAFVGIFLKVSMSSSRLEMEGQAAGFDADETVAHFGPANHFKGAEGVGGKLYLTNKRLRFRSHKINLNNHDESYALGEIAGVEPVRTLGIVPNGVLVRLRDGRGERFVVTGRADWVKQIGHAAAAAEG
jgi:hypothetical protein